MLVALSLLLVVGLGVVVSQIRRLQTSVVRLRAAGANLETIGAEQTPVDPAELIASFEPRGGADTSPL